MNTDTIAAIATPPGRGGVGIIRVSGLLSSPIALSVLGFIPKVRYAHFANFHTAESGESCPIDSGIALFFRAPLSFTGEDIIEFQCHGGPVLLDIMLQECLRLGARLATPGEFSQRAFINDKLDLAQAEAIADLINANSREAVKSAIKSLQGDFSKLINKIVADLTSLRVYVEAAIDFPEEEVDFLSDTHLILQLDNIETSLATTLASARQGSIMQEGITVVIAGKPNAGKSSLLNALAEKESAIVTEVAGTTRDAIREYITIDGLPIHIIDTAGIREHAGQVEQLGIERAKKHASEADVILWLIDNSAGEPVNLDDIRSAIGINKEYASKLILVFNKSDLPAPVEIHPTKHQNQVLFISAKTGDGLDVLKQYLKNSAGYHGGEGMFSARRRHVLSLEQALIFVQQGRKQLVEHRAGELLADDLLHAQTELGEITGKLLPDQLLGHIFTSFCIGK